MHTLKRAENGQEIKQNFKYMQDENSLSLENAVSRCCCCLRRRQSKKIIKLATMSFMLAT